MYFMPFMADRGGLLRNVDRDLPGLVITRRKSVLRYNNDMTVSSAIVCDQNLLKAFQGPQICRLHSFPELNKQPILNTLVYVHA